MNNKFTPDLYRFGLFRTCRPGDTMVPIAIYDTDGQAADAMRAQGLLNIERAESVGHPDELALVIIPLLRGTPEALSAPAVRATVASRRKHALETT